MPTFIEVKTRFHKKLSQRPFVRRLNKKRMKLFLSDLDKKFSELKKQSTNLDNLIKFLKDLTNGCLPRKNDNSPIT